MECVWSCKDVTHLRILNMAFEDVCGSVESVWGLNNRSGSQATMLPRFPATAAPPARWMLKQEVGIPFHSVQRLERRLGSSNLSVEVEITREQTVRAGAA